jgi:hypothetical protein
MRPTKSRCLRTSETRRHTRELGHVSGFKLHHVRTGAWRDGRSGDSPSTCMPVLGPVHEPTKKRGAWLWEGGCSSLAASPKSVLPSKSSRWAQFVSWLVPAATAFPEYPRVRPSTIVPRLRLSTSAALRQHPRRTSRSAWARTGLSLRRGLWSGGHTRVLPGYEGTFGSREVQERDARAFDTRARGGTRMILAYCAVP